MAARPVNKVEMKDSVTEDGTAEGPLSQSLNVKEAMAKLHAKAGTEL